MFLTSAVVTDSGQSSGGRIELKIDSLVTNYQLVTN